MIKTEQQVQKTELQDEEFKQVPQGNKLKIQKSLKINEHIQKDY